MGLLLLDASRAAAALAAAVLALPRLDQLPAPLQLWLHVQHMQQGEDGGKRGKPESK